MIDETTDFSNAEQVVIVIRWVNDDLSDSIQAKSLVAIIKDTLLRLNLKMELCQGQCYDGASVMSSTKSGVAATISSEKPRAVFTHCYGHSLNLAVGDTVR